MRKSMWRSALSPNSSMTSPAPGIDQRAKGQTRGATALQLGDDGIDVLAQARCLHEFARQTKREIERAEPGPRCTQQRVEAREIGQGVDALEPELVA